MLDAISMRLVGTTHDERSYVGMPDGKVDGGRSGPSLPAQACVLCMGVIHTEQ